MGWFMYVEVIREGEQVSRWVEGQVMGNDRSIVKGQAAAVWSEMTGQEVCREMSSQEEEGG